MVAGASVEPVSIVRNLGVYIDRDLGAAIHVCRTVSHCFAALRQLRRLRCHVTKNCLRSLVVLLVHSRLDYSNFVFVRLPAYLQRRLQTILNAAACLVFQLRRYEHMSDTLVILHWLHLPERVNFKLVLMAKCWTVWRHHLYQLVPVSSLPGRSHLRSSFTLQLHIPLYRLSTAGRRSFPAAASIFWNSLPDDVQSAPSISSFRQQLNDIPVSPVISGHHSLNFRTMVSWTLQQFRMF